MGLSLLDSYARSWLLRVVGNSAKSFHGELVDGAEEVGIQNREKSRRSSCSQAGDS